jgi:NTE family protein
VTGRALVLGGGGVAGISWMVGVLTGLVDAGVDVSDADLVVGTSAGSVAAALLLTAADDMYARQVDPALHADEIFASVDLDEMATRFGAAVAGATSEQELLAAIGAMALETETVPESVRRAVIASRLPVTTWPATLRVPAIDASTGELVVFDATSGFDLVDCVAASCAVPGIWPPVTLGERRYIDGGVRTTLNADLAIGADAVLVLAPMGLAGTGPLTAGLDDVLPKLGRVLAVEPSDEAREAIGANPLDPATRRPAAEAGRKQGGSEAARVRELWTQ